MAYVEGTIIDVRGWNVFSQKIKDLCGTTGLGNWSFVENIPAGTGLGTSGHTAFSVDVFKCDHDHLDASGLATAPFYFALQIPVADLSGAVLATSFSGFESYEGGTDKRFKRPIATSSNWTPVGEGWRSDTWAQYAQVSGKHTGGHLGSVLATGFSYWIKMTNSAIFAGTIQGTTYVQKGLTLMDSVINNINCPDQVPLVQWEPASNPISKMPGVTTALISTNGGKTVWECWSRPGTYAVPTILGANGDLWQGLKGYMDRIIVRNYGITAANIQNYGLFRGFIPDDFWFIPGVSSTECYPGDTLTINAETWVIIGPDSTAGAWFWLVTRKN